MTRSIAGVGRIGQGGLEESGLEVFGWGARYLPAQVGDTPAGECTLAITNLLKSAEISANCATATCKSSTI